MELAPYRGPAPTRISRFIEPVISMSDSANTLVCATGQKVSSRNKFDTEFGTIPSGIAGLLQAESDGVEYSELGHAGYSGWLHVASARDQRVRPQVIPEPISVRPPPMTTPRSVNHCHVCPD